MEELRWNSTYFGVSEAGGHGGDDVGSVVDIGRRRTTRGRVVKVLILDVVISHSHVVGVWAGRRDVVWVEVVRRAASASVTANNVRASTGGQGHVGPTATATAKATATTKPWEATTKATAKAKATAKTTTTATAKATDNATTTATATVLR